MKLKKIASLMLAGIMAVSMLAGCKGNTVNENPGEQPEEPVASDVASAFNDALDEYTSGVEITVKESSYLNAKLADKAKGITLAALKNENYKTFTDELDKAFGINNMAKLDNTLISNYLHIDGITKPTVQTYRFYSIEPIEAVSNVSAEDAAANKIVPFLKGLKNEFTAGPVGQELVYTGDYTLYVAEVNVTVVGDETVPVVVTVLEADIARK